MHVSEAVVLSASERPDGVREVELQAVCPAANLERLNVVLGSCRAAVPLDRPGRGESRKFKVAMKLDMPLGPGDKVLVRFFNPGEQAGVFPPRRATQGPLSVAVRDLSGPGAKTRLAHSVATA